MPPPPVPDGPQRRHLHVDGSALPNPGPLAFGCVYVDDDGATHTHGALLHRLGDNNAAEALAITGSLAWCHESGFVVEVVWSDSRVVVDALTGLKTSTLPTLGPLLQAALDAVSAAGARICWVPRHRNQHADAVARAALQTR